MNHGFDLKNSHVETVDFAEKSFTHLLFEYNKQSAVEREIPEEDKQGDDETDMDYFMRMLTRP